MCEKRYYHGSAASCLAANNVLGATGPCQIAMTSHVEYLRVLRLVQLYAGDAAVLYTAPGLKTCRVVINYGA